MFNKVAVLILIAQQFCLIYNRTLPTHNTDNEVEPKNTTTSFYRRDIFGPKTYAFGFEVNDKASGNKQFRDERRYSNGTVQGSYGYVRPDGCVMIVHYLIDSELGYLSQIQNYKPGEEPKWLNNWPTTQQKETEVLDDVKKEVNLTAILLPVTPIQEAHGIDLNPSELEKELINPAVLAVINGEAPLISNPKSKDNSIGFETIHEFIPPKFPIVPFALPSSDVNINVNEGLGEKPIPVLKKTTASDAE